MLLICSFMTTITGGKVMPSMARRILKGFKKQKKDSSEFVSLNHSLAMFIINDKFNDSKHIITINNSVFIYTGGVWIMYENTYLPKVVYDSLVEIMSTNKSEDMRDLVYENKKQNNLNRLADEVTDSIKKITTSAVVDDVLNLNNVCEDKPTVFNTLNKEIYVEGGNISVVDHNYSSYLTSQLSTEYIPDADCPNFMMSLNNVFRNKPDKDDVIRHFLECWGYIIQNKKDMPMWMLLVGQGHNGKSFIVQQLTRLMGVHSCVNMSIGSFSSDQHAEASLVGKYALVDDDLKKGIVLDDSFMKRVSENKEMSANRKFKDRFQFVNKATPIILANNFPRISDVSTGFERRPQVFGFDYKFMQSEVDRTLATKIAKERPGILNVLIKHYIQLVKRGNFL